MKKILFFAFALVASVLAFTSCEGKDTGDVLTGTWAYNVEAKQTGGVYECVTFSGKDAFAFERCIYNANGSIHVGPDKLVGTYVIEGNTFTATMHYEGDEQQHVNKYEFAIEGKTLTATLIEGGTFYPAGTTIVYTKQ